MARLFNGTSDKGVAALNLSGYSLITIAFWLWWDSYASNDDFCLSYSQPYGSTNSFYIDPNSTNSAFVEIAMILGSPIRFWDDKFTRPTAAAWHHHMVVFNRATPATTVYIDGAVQTLTTIVHQAATYANFANSNLNVMHGFTSVAALFGAGRMAELAIWGGVALTPRHAQGMSSGGSPVEVAPDGLVFYDPMRGIDSPEPDYGGTKKNITLTGTSYTPHPPVQVGMLRRAA